MLPLFSYGMLRDADAQRALFDREYPTHPATLHDYIVIDTGGDYLSVLKHEGGHVEGALIELDECGYDVADRWEDLDVYTRTGAVAFDERGKHIACFVYVRQGASGPRIADDRIANVPHDTILGDIRRFRAGLT
ncbi:MAG: hypothetical protein NVSMB64_04380 [Candidatus Velthaea sp.]